jgi:hypothetical protein
MSVETLKVIAVTGMLVVFENYCTSVSFGFVRFLCIIEEFSGANLCAIIALVSAVSVASFMLPLYIYIKIQPLRNDIISSLSALLFSVLHTVQIDNHG